MKRFLSIPLLLCMILLIPLNASAETTTITVEIPEPSYQLTIPSDLTISYRADTCTLAVPTVSNASGFKEGMYLKLAVSYTGKFSCATATTEIPFSFHMGTSSGTNLWTSGECLTYARNEDGSISSSGTASNGETPTSMVLSISEAAWEAAFPGVYTTAITFSASLAGME